MSFPDCIILLCKNSSYYFDVHTDISLYCHSACDVGTLSREKVKGKIVYCQGSGGDSVVRELGGVGTIMSSEIYPDTAMPTVAAGAYVSIKDGERIDKYINSTR